MKKELLVIASEKNGVRNSLARLKSVQSRFTVSCLDLSGTGPRGIVRGMRMVAPRRQLLVQGYGRLPDIRPLLRAGHYSAVYFDSFALAHALIPVIRGDNPSVVVALQSCTAEVLHTRVFSGGAAAAYQTRPLAKLREMERLAQRQANFVFADSASAAARLRRSLPFLNNIRAAGPGGRLTGADAAALAAAVSPRTPGGAGTVSIVMPVCNELRFTRRSLRSIYAARTRQRFEIIVVDNGSTDGTGAFLAAERRRRKNFSVISNRDNLGFTRAVNQGIRCARGEYVVLLNNDTIAGDYWLDKLRECFAGDRRVGAVAPVLDYPLDGDGVSLARSYAGARDFRSFRKAFERLYRNVWLEVPFIPFWCVMFRRSTLAGLGPLDERCFNVASDTDYCFAMLRRGLRLIVRMDLFVHHYGGGTAERLGHLNGRIMEGFRRLALKRGAGFLDYASRTMGEMGLGFVSLPPGNARGREGR